MRGRPTRRTRRPSGCWRCSAGRTTRRTGRSSSRPASAWPAAPAAGDMAELLRDADLALRYAKQRGKNRVERYDAALRRAAAPSQHRWSTSCAHAIERDELRLVFQPVVALPSVRPVGAEALLRWHHPELGSGRPGRVHPGRRGVRADRPSSAPGCCTRPASSCPAWLADGHDVWVSVNVSPRELHAPTTPAQVADVLRAHRVPPQRLVLEVTEHAVATDMDELIRRLGRAAADRGADRARRLRRGVFVARPAAQPAGRHPEDRPQPGRGAGVRVPGRRRPAGRRGGAAGPPARPGGASPRGSARRRSGPRSRRPAAGWARVRCSAGGCRPSTWRRCWCRPGRGLAPDPAAADRPLKRAAAPSGPRAASSSCSGRDAAGPRCCPPIRRSTRWTLPARSEPAPTARGAADGAVSGSRAASRHPLTKMWDQLTQGVRCGRLSRMCATSRSSTYLSALSPPTRVR